mmetsp:Transcript_18223/g.37349  ORF Transcript_18223/g.37349 Transcript_18223/m.37349 type:complete len:96 (-) Transcript_18223:313-600(-)
MTGSGTFGHHGNGVMCLLAECEITYSVYCRFPMHSVIFNDARATSMFSEQHNGVWLLQQTGKTVPSLCNSYERLTAAIILATNATTTMTKISRFF